MTVAEEDNKRRCFRCVTTPKAADPRHTERPHLTLRPAAYSVQVVAHHGRLVLEAAYSVTGDPVQNLRDERMNEMLSWW